MRANIKIQFDIPYIDGEIFTWLNNCVFHTLEGVVVKKIADLKLLLKVHVHNTRLIHNEGFKWYLK